MTRSIIAELAQKLGKSEEEIVKFFQLLWEVMPPSPETQPYFFRYLDERFLRLEDRYTALKEEMQRQIETLRKEMQQGDDALLQQIEALRKEMQQSDAALLQQIETLRKEMQQQIEVLRGEIKHTEALLHQEIEALRQQIDRLEKWLFALTVPVLVSTIGILGLLVQAFLIR